MRYSVLLPAVFLLTVFIQTLQARVIHVPGDSTTIQSGINGAEDGDTVLVASGTYVENINFFGKAITVKSEGGPDETIIDGGSPADPDSGCVVFFVNHEGFDSVLEGFTLTGGTGAHICNQSKMCGGGIACKSSSPTIIGNTITGNTVDANGGGILATSGSDPTIIGNTITGNTAGTNGGGIRCYGSSLVLTNSTIAMNSAQHGGGIALHNNSVVSITNSILWNDDSDGMGEEVRMGTSSTLDISYSDVEGGQDSVYADTTCTVNWGEGMIDDDPLFVDPGADDYELLRDSPCVDTGDPAYDALPGGACVIDMGAHEYWQGISCRRIKSINAIGLP